MSVVMSINFAMNFFIVELSPETKEKTSFNMYIFSTREVVDLGDFSTRSKKVPMHNSSKSFWPLGHGHFYRGMAREWLSDHLSSFSLVRRS